MNRHLTRLCLPLAALGALAGCLMGQNYKRPQSVTPKSYRIPAGSGETAATTVTLMADMPWWTMFKDPQLQTLIKTALENNLDLKLAVSRVEEARAMVGVNSADLFPSISGTGSAKRTRTANTKLGVGESPRANDYTALLNLSYEVDLWGRLRRTREAAVAELLSSGLDRKTAISTLISSVAESYFNLIELDREAQITSDTLHTYQQTLALTEAKYKEDNASQLDVSTYRAEVASAKASLDALKQQIFETENALSILLGQPPSQIRRGLSLEAQPLSPSVPMGLPADLIERRPDVLSSEQLLVAANANVGAAKAAFLPQISLTGESGYQSPALNTLLENNSHRWGIGGTVNQPIFNAATWYAYKLVKARQETALLTYRKSILTALQEISNALIAKQQSGQMRMHREDQIKSLTKSVELAGARYQEGVVSYLDLLDAERQLLSAQLSMEQARRDELLASISLYKALGGGIEAAPTPTPARK